MIEAAPERTLSWTFREPAPGWNVEPDAIVWIDVMAFDQVWSRSDDYVAALGVGGQGQKYLRAGAWFLAEGRSDMLQVWLDPGGVGFTDGRHRFAWLRDRGVEAIPVQVSPEIVGLITQRFGAEARISRLKRDRPPEPH